MSLLPEERGCATNSVTAATTSYDLFPGGVWNM